MNQAHEGLDLSKNLSQLSAKIFSELNRALHPDTDTIHNAQQNLCILSSNPQFLSALLGIPLHPGISKNIAKLAITYCRNFISKMQYSQKQSQIIKAMEGLVMFLQMQQVDENLRKQACQVLINLLKGDKNKLLLLACQQKLNKQLQNSIIQINQEKWEGVRFQYLGMFTFAVISAISTNKADPYVQFIQRSFDSVVKLGHIVCIAISEQIELGGMQIQSKKLDLSQNQSCQKASSQFKVLLTYLNSLQKYIQVLQSLKTNNSHLLNSFDLSKLLEAGLQLNLPNNTCSLPLFYMASNKIKSNKKDELIQIILKAKIKIIILLTKCFPALVQTFEKNSNFCKQQLNMESQNTNIPFKNTKCYLLEQGINYIDYFLQASFQIVDRKSWWTLNSYEIQVLIEVSRFLRACLQSNLYYKKFFLVKPHLVYGIILKLLLFSPKQYSLFHCEPDELINQIYQIIGEIQQTDQNKQIEQNEDNKIMERSQINENTNKNEMEQDEIQEQNQFQTKQQQIQLQNFETFKSELARLLVCYTAHVDGSLTELILLCLTVLQSPTAQTTYKKDLMFLLLCILRDNVQNNPNLIVGIGRVLIAGLRFRQAPKKANFPQKELINASQKNGTEYLLILIGFERYLQLIDNYALGIYENLLVVIEGILLRNDVEDAIKLVSCSLLNKMLKTNKIALPALNNLLYAILQTLSAPKISLKFVQSLEQIIKYSLKTFVKQIKKYQLEHSNTDMDDSMSENDIFNGYKEAKTKQKEPNLTIALQIMERVIQIINSQSQKQAKKDAMFQGVVYLGKLWNILRDFGSEVGHLEQVAQQIYKNISPLISTISDTNQQIIQENLYPLLCLILKKTHLNTYQSSFQRNFTKVSLLGTVLLQVFHFYNIYFLQLYEFIIASPYKYCQMLVINVSVYDLPRSEGEMFQGVMLMQSVIVGCHKNIQAQVWISLLDVLYQKWKADNIVYDFLRCGIITNIMLIVVFAYKLIEPAKLKELLRQFLKCHYYFTYKNSAKIFTVSVIQLLSLLEVPTIRQLCSQIIDCALTMLKLIQNERDKTLQAEELDVEQTYYFKLKGSAFSCLDRVDQFQLFRTQFQKAKRQFKQLIDSLYANFSESKKQYMKELFNLKKVNENIRVIYKLKHK